ncbi:MAG: hypothetical protein HC875_17970 [Anaerolineales bacterium]|nr:hypothetical protein [Anaerolineales bacterium]
MIKPVHWKTRLELLSPAEVQTIHAASLQIMERTGLKMPLDPARRLRRWTWACRLTGRRSGCAFPP